MVGMAASCGTGMATTGEEEEGEEGEGAHSTGAACDETEGTAAGDSSCVGASTCLLSSTGGSVVAESGEGHRMDAMGEGQGFGASTRGETRTAVMGSAEAGIADAVGGGLGALTEMLVPPTRTTGAGADNQAAGTERAAEQEEEEEEIAEEEQLTEGALGLLSVESISWRSGSSSMLRELWRVT
jgi:hypothetical protein